MELSHLPVTVLESLCFKVSLSGSSCEKLKKIILDNGGQVWNLGDKRFDYEVVKLLVPKKEKYHVNSLFVLAFDTPVYQRPPKVHVPFERWDGMSSTMKGWNCFVLTQDRLLHVWMTEIIKSLGGNPIQKSKDFLGLESLEHKRLVVWDGVCNKSLLNEFKTLNIDVVTIDLLLDIMETKSTLPDIKNYTTDNAVVQPDTRISPMKTGSSSGTIHRKLPDFTVQNVPKQQSSFVATPLVEVEHVHRKRPVSSTPVQSSSDGSSGVLNLIGSFELSTRSIDSTLSNDTMFNIKTCIFEQLRNMQMELVDVFQYYKRLNEQSMDLKSEGCFVKFDPSYSYNGIFIAGISPKLGRTDEKTFIENLGQALKSIGIPYKVDQLASHTMRFVQGNRIFSLITSIGKNKDHFSFVMYNEILSFLQGCKMQASSILNPGIIINCRRTNRVDTRHAWPGCNVIIWQVHGRNACQKISTAAILIDLLDEDTFLVSTTNGEEFRGVGIPDENLVKRLLMKYDGLVLDERMKSTDFK